MENNGAGPSLAAPPPPPAPVPSPLLAPGFRFHPTDEELVIYYLKRKVSGRPLRVDPIAELDLYKCEPWDLPALSRLRSRDMEWYFFSPLDRKYANRSRTNRATDQGYWKTTGKDRPVRHSGHTVGMKKTLVFHSGRAPRGKRTNWVMHEYRLEEPVLPHPQISQDGYVVCRIFQKSGAGPQNGAQYGAPFIEEDWEEEDGDDVAAPAPQGGNYEFVDAPNQDYLQLTDFIENPELGNQQENMTLLTMGTVEQNGDAQLEETTILLEDIQNDQSLIIDVDAYINMPGEQVQMPINDMEGNTGMCQTDGSPTQSDGYMELNDLMKRENASSPSNKDFIGSLPGTCTDLLNVTDGSGILPDMNGGEDFFDIVKENYEQPELFQMSPTVQDDIYQQPNNFLNPASGGYPPCQSTEDNMVFLDALSHEPEQENFKQVNDLLYTPLANPSGFDMVDELMAFFDATDANLHYASLDSLEKPENADSYTMDHTDFAPQVDGASISKAATVASSSSTRVPLVDKRLSGKNEDVCGASDVPGKETWDKSLTKRLVNMLGSISSPPALAAEFPAKAVNEFAQNSANNSDSSIHVTAGMIHIRSLAMTGSGEHWSMPKNGSVGFLFSYGMAGNAGKPVAFEPETKAHGAALTVVLRGWFYFFFLSALFLAASFRIGVCIYSR